MKIAVILPKLVSQAPILVAKDLIDQIKNKVSLIDIYYFEGVDEVGFDCDCYKIPFLKPIDFDKYDIIHSHMMRPDLYIWKHRKHIKKAKCVSTLHNDIFKVLRSTYNFFTSFIAYKLWLRALRHQDCVVVLSENMKHQYSSRLNKSKMQAIYNGRKLSSRLIEQIDSDDDKIINKIKLKFKIIGVSARLNKIKGFSQLVESLVHLKDFSLVFVGDGDEKENLVSLATRLGVKDRCFFLGYRKDGYRYLAYFDVYAMTSYSEGFPLGLLEAGQFKLPVVCSNLPIFKELFNESEVAFFELDNIKSLAVAIGVLYKNRDAFSEKIFQKVTQDYSVENMAKKYLSLYEKMQIS